VKPAAGFGSSPTRSVSVHGRVGRISPICQEEGLNDRYCPETDIEFDAPRFTSADKLRGAECFCTRATLDDLLSDEVMAPVLRSSGYEPDEFREMMTEMAWNLATP